MEGHLRSARGNGRRTSVGRLKSVRLSSNANAPHSEDYRYLQGTTLKRLGGTLAQYCGRSVNLAKIYILASGRNCSASPRTICLTGTPYSALLLEYVRSQYDV